MTRRLVVVGAGITGLSAAFEWRRRRPDDEIVVLEAGDRIGGKLHRVELAGHWYDTGPEAVLASLTDLDVPLVHFGVGTGELLRLMGEAGADVVGVDWRVPLDEAARRTGGAHPVQGNLDPAVLFADRASIEAEARRIVAEGRRAPGHVFNLGHGVLPDTDPDVLTWLVELVHSLQP